MALPKLNSVKYDLYLPGLGKTVQFRPYLVKEEKILMMALESQDQKQILNAVVDIIDACVYDDINVKKLAVFDVELLFITLRSKSVGEGVEVNMKCSECETENPVSIALDEINVPEVDNDNKTVMITDNVGITLRFPSFQDVQKQKPEEMDTMEGILKLLAACIETIFDAEEVHDTKDLKQSEVLEFIEQMNNTQFQLISSFFNDMPSLKSLVKFKCVNCKHDNEVELRGIQSFFT